MTKGFRLRLFRSRRLNLDDPGLTEARIQVIQKKTFLKKIYLQWYRQIERSLPAISGPTLELGSGAGFLSSVIPGVISSDVFYCSNVDCVLDAMSLPFPSSHFRAIVMTDVFHHIPNVRLLLKESLRCLQDGGRLILVEPWVSSWSRWVYTHFHHEPFDWEAREWEFPSTGPLSGANGALPWIVFSRDRRRFKEEFPGLIIKSIEPCMTFLYLLSGGLSWPSFVPSWSFDFFSWVDGQLNVWADQSAMFALIVVEKVGEAGSE